MVELIENHFGNPPKEPYEELNLMAHSQGGLITQHALDRYKKDLKRSMSSAKAEELLSNINVKSFGTAVAGWTKGPKYEQFTNVFDPVPQVIASAQLNYYDEIFTPDTMPIKNIKKNIIADPNINPIESHNMNGTYMKRLKEVSGKENKNKCETCVN